MSTPGTASDAPGTASGAAAGRAPAARPLAIVIGVGPGLGRALALAFAGHGMDLGLIARDAARLEAIAEEVAAAGSAASVAAVDARDPQRLAEAVADLGRGRAVHILAYNAMLSAGSLSGVSLEDLEAASAVNLHAPVMAVHAARASLEANGGSVLVTGGGLALHPVGQLGVLSAGKAALRAATFALADELEPKGVRVRTVTVAGRIQPGGALAPDRIAEVFWDLHTRPDGPVEVVLEG